MADTFRALRDITLAMLPMVAWVYGVGFLAAHGPIWVQAIWMAGIFGGLIGIGLWKGWWQEVGRHFARQMVEAGCTLRSWGQEIARLFRP